MYKKKKKPEPRKVNKCPHCAKFDRDVILEYTEKFGWHSGEVDIIKAELRCPNCNKIFWLKSKVESE